MWIILDEELLHTQSMLFDLCTSWQIGILFCILAICAILGCALFLLEKSRHRWNSNGTKLFAVGIRFTTAIFIALGPL